MANDDDDDSCVPPCGVTERTTKDWKKVEDNELERMHCNTIQE